MRILRWLLRIWPFVKAILVYLAVALGLYVYWKKYHRWEPALLIVGTVVATQFGTSGARFVLSELRLRCSSYRNLNDASDRKLSGAVIARDMQVEVSPFGGALDSFLNEVIAAWGLVALILTQCLLNLA